jgi:hypothetical protein
MLSSGCQVVFDTLKTSIGWWIKELMVVAHFRPRLLPQWLHSLL